MFTGARGNVDDELFALWKPTGYVRCSRCSQPVQPDDDEAAVVEQRPVCGGCMEANA